MPKKGRKKINKKLVINLYRKCDKNLIAWDKSKGRKNNRK